MESEIPVVVKINYSLQKPLTLADACEQMFKPTYQPMTAFDLERRLDRMKAASRKRVAVVMAADTSIEHLPTIELTRGQAFSIPSYEPATYDGQNKTWTPANTLRTFTVIAKQIDPRGGAWIIANGMSFHTSQIPSVLAVKVNKPINEAPVLDSIGKRITDLTPDDFKSGHLPTPVETAAALKAGHIDTRRYQIITTTRRLHEDAEMYFAIEQEAAKLA